MLLLGCTVRPLADDTGDDAGDDAGASDAPVTGEASDDPPNETGIGDDGDTGGTTGDPDPDPSDPDPGEPDPGDPSDPTADTGPSGEVDVAGLGPTITGVPNNAYPIGTWIRAAGDLNGDGRDDLMVARADYYLSPFFGTRVVFGTDSPDPISLADVDDFIGGAAFPHMEDMAAAGDMNGDGFDDLAFAIVRPPDSPDGFYDGYQGLLLGGPEPDRPMKWAAFDDSVQIRFSWAGYGMCSIGDINGDGLGEVVYGSNDVVPPTLVPGDVNLAGGFFDDIPVTQFLNMNFSECTNLGDVNGDGYRDFATNLWDADWNSDEGARGHLYVIYGGPEIPPAFDADAITAGIGGFRVRGAGPDDYFGDTLTRVGDVDGDGLADILAGAHGADAEAGAFYLIPGRAERGSVELAAPPPDITRFGSPLATENLAMAVAGPVDFDFDGRPDFVAGSPCNLGKVEGCQHRVFLFQGVGAPFGPSVDAVTSPVTFIGGVADDDLPFGSAIVSLDFDGDGMKDLAIAAPTEDSNGTNSGRIYIVLAKNLL